MSKRRPRQKSSKDYAGALDALAGGSAPPELPPESPRPHEQRPSPTPSRKNRGKPPEVPRPPAPQHQAAEPISTPAAPTTSAAAPSTPKPAARRSSAPPTPPAAPARQASSTNSTDSKAGDSASATPADPNSSPESSGSRPAITRPSRQRKRQSVRARPRATTPSVPSTEADPAPTTMTAPTPKPSQRREASRAHKRLSRTTIPVCLMLAAMLPLLGVAWLLLPATSPLAAAPPWTPWLLIGLGGLSCVFAVVLMRQVARDVRQE